ncbi:MAG: ABC transporter substrate-binding protein, partial [Pseudomonadota bacterium]
LDMQAEYNWGNAMAVDQLRQDPNVELREIPSGIFEALRELSQQAADELSARDEFSARVKSSIDAFMVKSSENLKIGELTYLNKRLAG